MVSADFAPRIPVDWPTTLEGVLQVIRATPEAVVVFDLDSTLFDNRPRQARIVREYGREHGLAAFERCQSFHFTDGWSLAPALVACGVEAQVAADHERPLKRFWGARFFTSEYCVDDVEVLGAPRYVHACLKAGAKVLYVTGRYERMREGTVKCLERCGIPTPGPCVELLMKPQLRDSDDAFKRQLHPRLKQAGRLIAFFDNEPHHVNDYAAGFPEATIVHLATDHSGRTLELAARARSVPHFAW